MTADLDRIEEALKVTKHRRDWEDDLRRRNALDSLASLRSRLEEMEEALAEAEAVLMEIAGPTPISHRGTIDQLTDAVKWRRGIAQDYFGRAALAAQGGRGMTSDLDRPG